MERGTIDYPIEPAWGFGSAVARAWLVCPRISLRSIRATAATQHASQPLLQETHEPRPHEAGIARRFLDRVVEPIVRRALHDAGAHEEIRLLEPQQERVGLRAPVDEVVLGAHGQKHADLIV